MAMYSPYDTLRWVSPFGNLRIEAHLQLPVAYRSLSRPSSAPDAKAFPLRSYQLDLSQDLTNQEKSNILVLSHYSKNYAGSISEVFKTKLYLLPLNFKSFPLLLPSHNCIHNHNVQFSRCRSNLTRDSMKYLLQGTSVNLFKMWWRLAGSNR